MPRPASTRVRKNFRLQPDALARAQAALGTRTETDTIDVALRLAAGEAHVSARDDADDRVARGLGILKHFGSIPPHEADAMLKAIEEGCNRVDNVDAPQW